MSHQLLGHGIPIEISDLSAYSNFYEKLNQGELWKPGETMRQNEKESKNIVVQVVLMYFGQK